MSHITHLFLRILKIIHATLDVTFLARLNEISRQKEKTVCIFNLPINCREKTCLRGLQPDKTQSSLLSYRE